MTAATPAPAAASTNTAVATAFRRKREASAGRSGLDPGPFGVVERSEVEAGGDAGRGDLELVGGIGQVGVGDAFGVADIAKADGFAEGVADELPSILSSKSTK